MGYLWIARPFRNMLLPQLVNGCRLRGSLSPETAVVKAGVAEVAAALRPAGVAWSRHVVGVPA